MKAIILAGGYGKRLYPLTQEIPKPLIKIKGKPIIQWQIEWLKKYSVDELVILAGYLKEKIISELGSGQKLGVKIGYAVEDEPLGTGGAIRNAFHLLDDLFIVLNGDVITNLNPLRLIEELRNSDKLCAIALIPLRVPYGVVELNGKNVKVFREKPLLKGYYMNAGIYAMRKEIENYLPLKGDVEKTTFTKLAEEGKILGVLYEEVQWNSIDSIKDIEEVEKILEDDQKAINVKGNKS